MEVPDHDFLASMTREAPKHSVRLERHAKLSWPVKIALTFVEHDQEQMQVVKG